jgi:hypothetical protein
MGHPLLAELSRLNRSVGAGARRSRNNDALGLGFFEQLKKYVCCMTVAPKNVL